MTARRRGHQHALRRRPAARTSGRRSRRWPSSARPPTPVVSVTPGGSRASCAGSQPDFWKSEMSTISRRLADDDSSRPAAARRAGPIPREPGAGLRPIDGGHERRAAAVRAGADLDVGREEHDRRAVAGRETPHDPPRRLLRARPVAAVAHAGGAVEQDDDLAGAAGRRGRRAGARQERPRERERRSARTRGCAARSSGQWRMARRRTDWFGIRRRNISDGNATTVRRSRCTRCTTIGIAMASRPASSAGARNDISGPGSGARAPTGSGTARGRAAPTC